MDINQMQYFVEIVKSNGNLTVAADNLFVSQSALSQFIKTLKNSKVCLSLTERTEEL